MKRRLVLRRDVLTALDSDELLSIAAGQPDTVNLGCVARLSDCMVLTLLLTPPCPASVDVNRCHTLLC